MAWMRDNKTSAWSCGLFFVQWGINTTYHEAIKMTPYEAVFGQKARMGLATKVPPELLKKITSGTFEEDMLGILTDTSQSAPIIPENQNTESVDIEGTQTSTLLNISEVQQDLDELINSTETLLELENIDIVSNVNIIITYK